MTWLVFLFVAGAGASLSYLFRSSAYMEHARNWWWQRAPRQKWVLGKDERPGRVWPLPVSKSWMLCQGVDDAGSGARFPMFADGLHEKPVPAIEGSPTTVWYSKDGIMLGRVLTCRMCFTFWTAALASIPWLWPYPGDWDWRSLAQRAVVVFAAWMAGTVLNAVMESKFTLTEAA